jgi:hypothetical protein
MKWLVPFVVFLLTSPCWAQLVTLTRGPGNQVVEVPAADPAYSAAVVKAFTDQQLIDCLKGPKNCALDTRYYLSNVIKWELAGRKRPDLIIAAYKKADDVDRFALVETLWYIDSPLVESFMRSIGPAFENPRDGIDYDSSVFALDYLAQSCDLNALARLNHDVFKKYPIKKYAVIGCSYLGPVQPAWDDTIEAFGRCNYVPAAQNLVRLLDSQCISADKAEKSLKQIFPGYCENPASVEEEQQCYEKVLHPDPKVKDH